MLEVRLHKSFRQDYRRAVARGLDPAKLREAVDLLREGKALPRRMKDHKLRNDRKYRDMRECHIQPDWLLIYRIYRDELVLSLVRTGTHSELLNK